MLSKTMAAISNPGDDALAIQNPQVRPSLLSRTALFGSPS